MKKNRNLLAATAGLAVCAAVVWFSTSIQGVEKTYEVQPQITIPEYRTDAARAIDAYEHLMDRFMDLNERNLTNIAADIQIIAQKLDSIDAKLTHLSIRMVGIEKALGIKTKTPTEKKACPTKTQKKSTENTNHIYTP